MIQIMQFRDYGWAVPQEGGSMSITPRRPSGVPLGAPRTIGEDPFDGLAVDQGVTPEEEDAVAEVFVLAMDAAGVIGETVQPPPGFPEMLGEKEALDGQSYGPQSPRQKDGEDATAFGAAVAEMAVAGGTISE